SNCTRTYTVQAGDVCDLISAAQGVSTFQLATVNAGVINPDCSNLFPHEVICLATNSQDCSPVHTVVSGDTCFDIATAAGITIPDIVAQNPNVTPDCNIYPGEVHVSPFFEDLFADQYFLVPSDRFFVSRQLRLQGNCSTGSM
ncbi:hypothetical protein BDQ12DRAFT_614801, partial [Crucibulum laeve]